MKILYKCAVVVVALICSQACLAAERYWGYQYKQFTVTARGNSDFARSIAHDLHRLDLALEIALKAKTTQWRPATAIYVLPGDLFTELSGRDTHSTSSISIATTFDNVVLINASEAGIDRMWSVYFSFGANLLATAYSFRYPPWFVSGLSEVIAASSVSRKYVTLGSVSPGRVNTLIKSTMNGNGWIPLHTLLTVRGNDPQMSNRDFEDMFAAESWYIVHKIVIDEFYSKNFYQYFLRLDQGEEESKAFSGSFDISVEQLDKAFQQSMRDHNFTELKLAVADEDDGSKPVKLSEAQSQARVAMYAAEHGVQPGKALELSAEALKTEPANEEARIARVDAELRIGDRDTALRFAREMCGPEVQSPKMLDTCGAVFGFFAPAVPDKSALPIAQPELRSEALRFFERDLQADPDDLRAWVGLAWLAAQVPDLAYIKALLPKVVAVQAANPRIGALAGATGALCYASGDKDSAMKYALLWQLNATSSGERARATETVSGLKREIERKQAAGAAAVIN